MSQSASQSVVIHDNWLYSNLKQPLFDFTERGHLHKGFPHVALVVFRRGQFETDYWFWVVSKGCLNVQWKGLNNFQHVQVKKNFVMNDKIILQWRCKFLWIHSSTSSWAKNAPQDTNQWSPGYRCASERPERSREALWWDYK